MKKIDINGFIIEVEKKKIKNMYLKILPPDGRIHISAPVGMREYQIRAFVISKQAWIQTQQNKLKQREYTQEIDYVTGDRIYVWGKCFSLLVSEDGKRSSVSCKEEQVHLRMKSASTPDQRKKALDQWYRSNLLQVIPEMLEKWENIIGVKSNGFHIRDMKTRWGTCNVRTKNICLNLQLAKKAPICLEYVVVHELVHLLERSHNHVFQAYMDRYLPDWRERKKKLNTN